MNKVSIKTWFAIGAAILGVLANIATIADIFSSENKIKMTIFLAVSLVTAICAFLALWSWGYDHIKAIKEKFDKELKELKKNYSKDFDNLSPAEKEFNALYQISMRLEKIEPKLLNDKEKLENVPLLIENFKKECNNRLDRIDNFEKISDAQFQFYYNIFYCFLNKLENQKDNVLKFDEDKRSELNSLYTRLPQQPFQKEKNKQ